MLCTFGALAVDGWTVRDIHRCLRTMYEMTSQLSSSSRRSKVCRRTCVVFLTTHGNTMNYDVRGSKLADLMMSARRCVASSRVLTLTSTNSVSDVWRHFTLLAILQSSTSTGFYIKFLYLNHGPKSSYVSWMTILVPHCVHVCICI